MTLTYPTLIPQPFASTPAGPNFGGVNAIPQASNAPLASLADGFPMQTMLALAAGGVPPSGKDFNGIFNLITQHTSWLNAGGWYAFSSSLATAIGGYPIGAALQGVTNPQISWISLCAANMANPESGPFGITASCAGNTLTVTATASALLVGQQITGNNIPANTAITNVSGTGPWTVTLSQTPGTLISQPMAAYGWIPENGGFSSAIGAVARPLAVKLGERITPEDFGAIGNGVSHQLSTVTSFGTLNTTGFTLGQWQAIFPHVTSLTNELDWCALQAAINFSNGVPINLAGKTYVVNQPGGTASYVLTAANETVLVGVQGLSRILLLSATTSPCYLIGSPNGVSLFRTEGVTYDCNQVTLSPMAEFNGTISGTTLTLTTPASGTMAVGGAGVGQLLTVNGVAQGCYLSALASGSLGAVGSTYTLNIAPSGGNVSSQTAMSSQLATCVQTLAVNFPQTVLNFISNRNVYQNIQAQAIQIGSGGGAASATFNGTIAGSALTLTSVATGTFSLGQQLMVNNLPTGMFIASLTSGSLGANGSVYALSGPAIVGNVAVSSAMASFNGANRFLCAEDTFQNVWSFGISTWGVLEATIKDSFFFGLNYSPFNLNPLPAPGQNARTKLRIANNVCVQGSSYAVGNSVISLMGDDVECTGNKVIGGWVGIVVHTAAGFTGFLYNYNVSGNFIWQTLGDAIVVNQDVSANIVVSGNTIYQFGLGNTYTTSSGTGIRVSGVYVGTTDTVGSTTVTGNTIYDGLGGGGNTFAGSANEPAGIFVFQAMNVVVNGNTILKPRYAGIYVTYDVKNIEICNNIIKDQYGQASTSNPTWYGGGILLMAGGAAANFSTIDVHDNLISKFMTNSVTANCPRCGGIVVNGSGVTASDISVCRNKINTGNGNGIVTISTTNFTAIDNIVENTFGTAIGAGGAAAFNPNALDTGMNVSRAVVLPGTGAQITAAATINPVSPVFHLTGATPVATITPFWSGWTGTITIIPDSAYTTLTSGNIGLVSTAIIARAMTQTFDGTKWYPSY